MTAVVSVIPAVTKWDFMFTVMEHRMGIRHNKVTSAERSPQCLPGGLLEDEEFTGSFTVSVVLLTVVSPRFRLFLLKLLGQAIYKTEMLS